MSTFNIPPAGVQAPPSITDYLQPPQVGMQPTDNEGNSFDRTLKKAMTPRHVQVKFTDDAQQRMEAMGIHLEVDDLEKLDNRINKARAGGAHEALIMLEGKTFAVNLDQHTVVTALNSNETKSLFGGAKFVD